MSLLSIIFFVSRIRFLKVCEWYPSLYFVIILSGFTVKLTTGALYCHACKKTFVTTVGKISPIKQEGIETYGELEVIDFIQRAQMDKNLLLIDARMSPWYMKGTIPSAINISFKLFEPKHPEFETVLETAGVEVDEGKYNFENAKTLLLFCNGIWCPQSTWAIENLLKIGYPKEKLLWYRGGIQSWKMLNLTTIVPKP